MKSFKSLLLALLLCGAAATTAEPITEVHIKLQHQDAYGINPSETADITPASIVNVVEKLAKYVQDDTVTSSDQLMIIGKDVDGNQVYRQVADNPMLLHAESFDPESGKIETAKTIHKKSATLRINIPSKSAIHTLEINTISKKSDGYHFQPWRKIELKTSQMDVTNTTAPKSALAANGVYSVFKTGDSANRADLVVLSEGYTSSDLTKFESDVQGIINGYFEEDIYKEYKNHFNVWRVEVASNQSGAGNGSPIDTKFGAYFNCYNIERLLCVNEDKVLSYLRSVMPANAMDKVLVVVNTEKYGGAGGQVATMSLASQTIDLALHELAHSFAKLADEYTYGNCNVYEPDSANATADSSGAKWRHWSDVDANIGVYEGAMYCAQGMYRPSSNSMMKELGQPFFAVNESEIIRRLYGYVDVIDAVMPSQTTINLNPKESQAFNVTLVNTLSSSVNNQWYVNDQKVSDGSRFTFDGSQYQQGVYRVKAMAADKTTRVKKDPNQLLQAQHSWTVKLGDSGSDCDKAPSTPTGLRSTDVGDTFFAISWNSSTSANSYRVELWNESASRWDTLTTTPDTSANAADLTAGSSQWVRVAAQNSCGDSEPSDYITIELSGDGDCTQAPGVPGTPTATTPSNGRFTLSWSAAKDASSYTVQKWSGWQWQDHQQSRLTSINLNAARSTHYYRVYASNSCGNSEASNWVRVDVP